MDITPGTQTSEHAAMQSSSAWGIVATVLGGLITIGSLALSAFGDNSKWGIVAGAVVTVAGQLQHLLATLGYIQARTDVKVAAAQAETPDSPKA